MKIEILEELIEGDLIAPKTELIFRRKILVRGRVEAWSVIADGDLEVLGSLTIKDSLKVYGCARVKEDLSAGGNIEVEGRLEVDEELRGNWIEAGAGIKAKKIKAREGIIAGYGIEVLDSVESGGPIQAGQNIEGGELIKAGKGYKIFAGLTVHEDNLPELGTINADKIEGEIGHGKRLR